MVTVHLEALDHCLTTRDELRTLDLPLHVPADGETLRRTGFLVNREIFENLSENNINVLGCCRCLVNI